MTLVYAGFELLQQLTQRTFLVIDRKVCPASRRGLLAGCTACLQSGMEDRRLGAARDFMQTYADGDAAALLALLTDDWQLHEADGSVTSRELIAQITEVHRDAFSEKRLEFLQELADGDVVAHHARFELRHTGRYHDLEATGRTAVLSEMIFHRFSGDRIAESWRMTYPDSVYEQLVGPPVAEG